MTEHNGALLVTGSAGLIGKSLVEQLKKIGEIVLELDVNFPENHPGHGDFCNIARVSHIITQCRGIIHLGAVSRVVWGEKDPQACWDINVTGTSNLLEAAYRSLNQPWVIYASSREVYGQQEKLPVDEDALLQPLNVYARSKVAAESLVDKYRRKGLITSTLRFSSVYGSIYDYHDRVVPAFCRNTLLNKPLRVDGLKHVLDFTHVEDVTRGVLAVIDKLDQTIKDLPPIHLTTGGSTSLVALVSLIAKILDKPSNFYEAPARTYDVHRFYGDPTRAKKLLNWEARIPLVQGLSKMLSEYQTHSLLLLDPPQTDNKIRNYQKTKINSFP